MTESVTIKELAALVVRRGRLCVCLALILALLLGGMELTQMISAMNAPTNSKEEIEVRYQQAMEAYTYREKLLRNELECAQKRLKTEQAYFDQSLLMNIDPYDVSVTRINLAIADLEESTFLQVFQIQGTPVDYIVSRIQNQYLVMWRSVDLQQILGGELEDKYLREVALVEAQSGGLLAITAYGTTHEESQALANATYQYFMESVDVVSESAYPHQFVMLSSSTKSMVNSDLEAMRQSVETNLEEYIIQAEQAARDLEALAVPVRDKQVDMGDVLLSTVKSAVVGVALGIILGAVWAIVTYLVGNKLTFADSLERRVSAPMLTSLEGRKNVWNRLSCMMLGQRTWVGEDKALEYLAQCAQHRLAKDETVALVTTLRCDESSHEIQKVINTLKANGHQVRFVNDTYYNAQTIAAIKESDSVVLAERCGRSGICAIDAVVAQIAEQNKVIKGYILI